MKKIDMHCHLYPEEFVREIKRHNLFSIHDLPEWISAEDRIADMDKYGIERQVLSPSSPFVYFEDDGINLHLAQLSNDFVADVCYKYPDRFSGLANVPLCNIRNSIDEMHRVIKKPGILGIGIGTRVREKPIYSPDFNEFYEEVDRLGIQIMIHPASPIGIERVNNYRDFHRSVGFLWETTMTVGEMALTGIFERYKNIKWILSHLGGALPFVYTSMDIWQRRNPSKEYVPDKPLSEHFRKAYVDTGRLLTPSILSCALDLYGEEHVMFGTDIPYAYDVASPNISRIEKFPISDELKEKIFYKNAKDLLKL